MLLSLLFFSSSLAALVDDIREAEDIWYHAAGYNRTLSCCPSTCIPPTLFCSATHVQTIAFDNTYLTGTIRPSGFVALSGLSAIFMGGNQLVGTVPSSLYLPASLTYLNLANARFSGPLGPMPASLSTCYVAGPEVCFSSGCPECDWTCAQQQSCSPWSAAPTTSPTAPTSAPSAAPSVPPSPAPTLAPTPPQLSPAPTSLPPPSSSPPSATPSAPSPSPATTRVDDAEPTSVFAPNFLSKLTGVILFAVVAAVGLLAALLCGFFWLSRRRRRRPHSSRRQSSRQVSNVYGRLNLRSQQSSRRTTRPNSNEYGNFNYMPANPLGGGGSSSLQYTAPSVYGSTSSYDQFQRSYQSNDAYINGSFSL